VETEPPQIVQSRLGRSGLDPRRIEIIDAEQPLALMTTGLQPRQQGSAQISQMQRA
jgi:hypothetical protein